MPIGTQKRDPAGIEPALDQTCVCEQLSILCRNVITIALSYGMAKIQMIMCMLYKNTAPEAKLKIKFNNFIYIFIYFESLLFRSIKTSNKYS